MRKNQVDVITLGCSKNLVDSEQLIRQFLANGYVVHHNSGAVNGEIVVLNTCGFIGDAQEESINMILKMVEAKKTGRIGQVYVMGCLTERFMDELKVEIPEVDGYYGKFNWKNLLTDLGKAYHNDPLGGNRSITTPAHYAYMKISEGAIVAARTAPSPSSRGSTSPVRWRISSQRPSRSWLRVSRRSSSSPRT